MILVAHQPPPSLETKAFVTMDSNELWTRTKQFAVRIIKLVAALPRNRTGDVLGRQLLKSGTSIGANYQEALRASSRRHFVTTLEIAVREGEETRYRLELLADSGLIKPSRLSDLARECNELAAILTATVISTKRQIRNHKPWSPLHGQPSVGVRRGLG